MTQISLAVELTGLKLRAPTLNASGVLGMSVPLLRRVYDAGVGAVVTKSLGPQARIGHLNPTIVQIENGVLNAMGLPNPGVDYFIDEIRKLKSQNVPVIASFFASTLKEFSDSASSLSDAGSDALELNLSCPNVEGEVGMCAADALSVERVTATVKAATDKPVLVKLSPNVTDIVSIAVAAEKGGADAITATNTLKAMTIDTNFKRPVLTNVTGGLSGPALKPIALRCVWEIFEAVEIPIIGCGGVTTGLDAVEYMLAGASAIEIGTAVISHGFEVYSEINEGIKTYLTENGYRKVSELVGGAHHV